MFDEEEHRMVCYKKPLHKKANTKSGKSALVGDTKLYDISNYWFRMTQPICESSKTPLMYMIRKINKNIDKLILKLPNISCTATEYISYLFILFACSKCGEPGGFFINFVVFVATLATPMKKIISPFISRGE